jgi:MYXO-CTERM domain-containing protein
VVAAVATIGTGGHPLRPLYEGIGPSAPYRWVHPPPAFRSTNTPPETVTESFDLTPTGSQEEPGGSGDGQLALSLAAGAIPPSPGRNSVLLSFAPVDPAKLGPLPVGLFSDGNAYLVTAFYQPGRVPIPAPAKPIDAVIRTPVSSTALLISTDGKAWTRTPDQHIPTQAAVAATITSFGYLLAVANVPVVPPSSSSGTSIILPIGLGIASLLLLGAALLWRSDRRRRPE